MKDYSNNLMILLVLLVIIFGVTNCNSENPINSYTKARLYMPQAQNSPIIYSANTDTSLSKTYIYKANYEGANNLKKNIKIEFSIEPSLVKKYNSDNSTSFSLLPKENYTLESKEATIRMEKESTPSFKLTINKSELPNKNFLLPITIKTNNNSIPIIKKLKTTYFEIRNTYEKLNTDIIITGFLANSWGYDAQPPGFELDYTNQPYGGILMLEGGYEYIQLMALDDIDFSETPYSLVVAKARDYYGGSKQGWAIGGEKTFKFDITEGKAKAGSFFYIGGKGKRVDGYRRSGYSTDISDANWPRSLQIAYDDMDIVAGDGFGKSTNNLLSSGDHVGGIAVFKGTKVINTTIPLDAVFYGKNIDEALRGSDNGYKVPENTDLYSAINEITGSKQSLFGQGTNTYLGPVVSGQFVKMGGVFINGGFIKPRKGDLMELQKNSQLTDIESGRNASKFYKSQ